MSKIASFEIQYALLNTEGKKKEKDVLVPTVCLPVSRCLALFVPLVVTPFL